MYRNALANAMMAKELLEKIFKFDVQIVMNPTKAEIIEKLAQLEAEALEFDRDHEPRTAFAFVLCWIGFKLD